MNKYRQIVEIIKREIRCGERAPGDKLPGQTQLAAQFEVSEITARRALDELTAAGLVERRHRSGSYVRQVPRYFRRIEIICTGEVKNPALWLGDYWNGVEASGREFGIEVTVSRQLPASTEDAGVILIGEDAAMIRELEVRGTPFISAVTRNRLTWHNVRIDYPAVAAALRQALAADGAKRIHFLGNLKHPNHRQAAEAFKAAGDRVHAVTEKTVAAKLRAILERPDEIDALAVMGGMLPFLALPALFGSRLPVRLGVFAENRAVAFLGEYAFLADYQLFEAGKLSFTLLNEVAADPALPRCVRSPEFHIYPPGTRPKENYASL